MSICEVIVLVHLATDVDNHNTDGARLEIIVEKWAFVKLLCLFS